MPLTGGRRPHRVNGSLMMSSRRGEAQEKRFMRIPHRGVALLSLVLPIALAMNGGAPAQSKVGRGRMLVIGGGCHDCHTTKKMGPKGPEPDMSKMLAGHPESIKVTASYKPATGSQWAMGFTDTLTAWSGPWGVSFAANLTPDPATGITSGVWSEDLFVKALKTGKHMG